MMPQDMHHAPRAFEDDVRSDMPRMQPCSMHHMCLLEALRVFGILVRCVPWQDAEVRYCFEVQPTVVLSLAPWLSVPCLSLEGWRSLRSRQWNPHEGGKPSVTL